MKTQWQSEIEKLNSAELQRIETLRQLEELNISTFKADLLAMAGIALGVLSLVFLAF